MIVTVQPNIFVTGPMTAILEFECRPAKGGYRVVAFDERKLRRSMELSKLPPGASDEETFRKVRLIDPLEFVSEASEDERYLVDRWPKRMNAIFARKPSIRFFLRPNSDQSRRFDLFKAGPCVFLEFGQITSTETLVSYTKGAVENLCANVTSFANRYGLLAADDYTGSSLDYWVYEIIEMRKALTAWEKANAGSAKELIRIVEKRARSGWDAPAGIEAAVLLKPDPINADRARLCVRPHSLINGLWTQLALAVDGSVNLGSCIECHAWFVLEAGRGRADKVYCSNACRMRAYRRRKGQK